MMADGKHWSELLVEFFKAWDVESGCGLSERCGGIEIGFCENDRDEIWLVVTDDNTKDPVIASTDGIENGSSIFHFFDEKLTFQKALLKVIQKNIGGE